MIQMEQHIERDETMEHLVDKARSLVENLESGNLYDTHKLLGDIYAARERKLYEEVGKLTRGLHDALMDLHIDAGIGEEAQEEISKISDASDRLGYVIKMTDDAANLTMDKVDEAVPIADEIRSTSKDLNEDWKRFKRRELTPEEFRNLYQRVGDYLDGTEVRAERMQNSLNDILMAQGYQDLTGQVIKRVITLVKEVENSLVELVRMASSVEKIAGINAETGDSVEPQKVALAGPNVHGEKNVTVVSGQDEVDDLLSSLGF